MIKALAHICFHVADIDKSLAFYTGKLGLEHAFDLNDGDGNRFGSYIHTGSRSFIELFQRDLAEKAEGQSFTHMPLEVDDIEAAVADLRAKGVEVSDHVLAFDHNWQAWLTDPDGNSIELHGYTPKSDQFRMLGE
jgi:lactoylglutathione lyase/glyoxylase I family protein